MLVAVSASGLAMAQPTITNTNEEVEPVTDTSPGEIIVITEKAPGEKVKSVTYELSPQVIRKLPGSGNDAIKSLQTMPSVGRVPFGLGGLVLRGTSPRDSNVYLDGIHVPLLYHFGGLASFYPSAQLSSLKLQPGGYSAQYGRGQGGIVTLESRAARRDRWRVATELSMVDAAVQADGPSGDWGGWSIALRRSYIDALLPLFATSSTDINNAPRYYDGQLRFDMKPWRNARLTAMMFGSDDEIAIRYGVDKTKSFQFNTRFARFGLRFQQRFKDTIVKVVPWLGIDRYHLASSFQTMQSDNNPAGLRAQVMTEYVRGYWAVGTDIASGDFAVSSLTINDDNTTEIAREGSYMDASLWAEAMVKLFGDKLAVKPGLRLERYGLAKTVVLDPRLVVTETLSERISLRQTIGVFHQPPSHADQLWGNDDLRASHSVQLSGGGTFSLNPRTTISLTGFYSELYNLAVDDPDAEDLMLNNLETYRIGAVGSTREFIARQFGTFSTLANIGRGRVYGAELMARYVGARGFAWLAYTYSRSWRRNGDDGARYRWILDQPHVATAVGSLKLGKYWRIGARMRVTSGNPVTPLFGRMLDASDEWRPVFGVDNSERLPAFYQLDVRVDRDWRGSWGTITAFLDVQNATQRVNVEGRVYDDDYSGYQPTGGLPLFPSFGVAYTPR